MAILSDYDYHECELCDRMATEEDAISIEGKVTIEYQGKLVKTELKICSKCLEDMSYICCHESIGDEDEIGSIDYTGENPIVICQNCLDDMEVCSVCKKVIEKGQTTNVKGDKHVGCIPSLNLFEEVQ